MKALDRIPSGRRRHRRHAARAGTPARQGVRAGFGHRRAHPRRRRRDRPRPGRARAVAAAHARRSGDQLGTDVHPRLPGVRRRVDGSRRQGLGHRPRAGGHRRRSQRLARRGRPRRLPGHLGSASSAPPADDRKLQLQPGQPQAGGVELGGGGQGAGTAEQRAELGFADAVDDAGDERLAALDLLVGRASGRAGRSMYRSSGDDSTRRRRTASAMRSASPPITRAATASTR